MKVTKSILLTKSADNSYIARIAVDNKYFDVAISRFYYSIYQRILNFLYSKKKNFNPKSVHGGSHEKTLYEFKDLIDKKYIQTGKIDKKYALNLAKLTYLKLYRVDADYSPVKTATKEFYQNEYLPCYNKCINLLDAVERD